LAVRGNTAGPARNQAKRKTAAGPRIPFEIKTAFTEEELAILCSTRIETPFDREKVLHILVTDPPVVVPSIALAANSGEGIVNSTWSRRFLGRS